MDMITLYVEKEILVAMLEKAISVIQQLKESRFLDVENRLCEEFNERIRYWNKYPFINRPLVTPENLRQANSSFDPYISLELMLARQYLDKPLMKFLRFHSALEISSDGKIPIDAEDLAHVQQYQGNSDD